MASFRGSGIDAVSLGRARSNEPEGIDSMIGHHRASENFRSLNRTNLDTATKAQKDVTP